MANETEPNGPWYERILLTIVSKEGSTALCLYCFIAMLAYGLFTVSPAAVSYLRVQGEQAIVSNGILKETKETLTTIAETEKQQQATFGLIQSNTAQALRNHELMMKAHEQMLADHKFMMDEMRKKGT